MYFCAEFPGRRKKVNFDKKIRKIINHTISRVIVEKNVDMNC